jgi:ornithine decarboxylase
MKTTLQYKSCPDKSENLSQPKTYTGPELSIKKHLITEQVSAFKLALPNVSPHYAVKANPLPLVLLHLDTLGVKFEIASQGELFLLLNLGIAPEKVVFSNPIKTAASIVAAKHHGIKWYAFDSIEELKKLHALVPKGHFELRLATNGRGSIWPLSTKFGLDDDAAINIIRYAARHHINIAGLTFHVGSQCTQTSSWLSAIDRCDVLFKIMKDLSMPIQLLNIGGGFPCDLLTDSAGAESHPSFQQLMYPVNLALNKLLADYPTLNFYAEPGRFLLAPAGTITCQIITTTKKQGEDWAFLDVGYYSGLMELTEEFGYKLSSKKDGELIPWTIAGPTCDSIDYFKPKYYLPKNSTSGDIITIGNMGAYTNTCATEFNGFPAPNVVVYP